MKNAQLDLLPPPATPAPLMTGFDPVTYRTDPALLRHAAIHAGVEAALRRIVEVRPNFDHVNIWTALQVALAAGTFPQSPPLTYDHVVMRHKTFRGVSMLDAVNELMADAANAVLEGCNSGAQYHSPEATRGICEIFGIDYDAIVAGIDGEVAP